MDHSVSFLAGQTHVDMINLHQVTFKFSGQVTVPCIPLMHELVFFLSSSTDNIVSELCSHHSRLVQLHSIIIERNDRQVTIPPLEFRIKSLE